MGSYSKSAGVSSDNNTNANLLIMEDTTPKNENPSLILKNPWWIKACFHVIIINSLLNILLIPGAIISFISALLFTWYGDKVQKDMFKVEGIFKSLVIVFCIMDIHSIYQSLSLIYKTGIYNILPTIKNIVEGFAALL